MLISKLFFNSDESYIWILGESLFWALLYAFVLHNFFIKGGEELTKDIKIDLLDADEEILFSGPSTIKGGFLASGGRLFVTNKRIYFQGHRINLKDVKKESKIEDIQSIEKSNPFFIMDSGIKLYAKNEDKLEFILNDGDRDKVYAMIEGLI